MVVRQKIIMGNWKMQGTLESIELLLNEILSDLPLLDMTCAVFPPSVYLPFVQKKLLGTSVAWGAQNMYPYASGAYTGEVSPLMLRDFGCRYVLVGHSERRQLFKEDEKIIAKKFHCAKEYGMIPVLCIGETQKERDEGKTFDVISRQLLSVVDKQMQSFDQCLIAYEPVWAIGTGYTATPEDAQGVHAHIREIISQVDPKSAESLSILYGGSVNEHNINSLMRMPDIDGGLVGGASLQAHQFLDIIKCIN